MDLTPDSMQAIFQGYRTIFDDAVGSTKTPLMSSGLVMTKTSATAEEYYAFLDRVPKLRKWLGPRRINNLIAEYYKLINELYEDTVGVKRVHIEDDKLGLYNQRFARMGQQSKKWPEYLVRDKLQDGKNETCFDGKKFFATDHYINFGKKSGSQANLFTAKPLTFDNFVLVKKSMRSLVGSDAEPLDDFGEELYLVVGPSLEDAALSIVKSETIVRSTTVGAVTNTQRNAAEVLVVPGLENSAGEVGVWYLLDKSGEGPIIFQERSAPDFVAQTAPDNPHVFNQDEFVYGTRARGVAGLGLWWKAARCEPS